MIQPDEIRAEAENKLTKWRERELALCRRADAQPSTQYAQRLGAAAEEIASLLTDFEPTIRGLLALLDEQEKATAHERHEKETVTDAANALVTSLRAERDALHAQLREYGQHKGFCQLQNFDTSHRSWCEKWQGFHESRYLDESKVCNCIVRHVPPCTCGFSSLSASGVSHTEKEEP